MRSPQLLPRQKLQRTMKWPILMGALLLPYLFYDLLPNLGVSTASNLFDLQKIFALFIFAIFGVLYVRYLQFVENKPIWIAIFITSIWVFAEKLNLVLMDEIGINIKFRVLLFLTMAVPAGWSLVRYAPAFNKTLPYLKYYLIFLGLVLTYFFLYNAGAVDPKRPADSLMADGSISWIQMNSYILVATGMVVAAVGLIKSNRVLASFDLVNKFILVSSSLLSTYTIIGYPTQLTSKTVDGFLRAFGTFSHPNPFSHHMGIMMVYLLGIYFYYQYSIEKRMPVWLLRVAIVVNLVALLLGLSKTAIATFGFCALLFFLLNAGSPRYRTIMVKTLGWLLLLLPLGLFAYQLATGKTLMSMAEARMEESTSLTWRNEVWDSLKADMWDTPIFGHGFTAANVRLYQLYYNTVNNSTPLTLVHNGYISLFYDFGIFGMSLFVAALALIWTAFDLWLKYEAFRPLSATAICLGVYFMVVANFDEMIYMFDSPHLVWTFSTLLLTVVQFQAKTAVPEGLKLPEQPAS